MSILIVKLSYNLKILNSLNLNSKIAFLPNFVCECREIMHAMWKPQKFKTIYLIATIYVLTLTLPSASAVYWAFGDALLTHSNALALLPKTKFRDSAVILMLIHQVTTNPFFFFYINT